MKFLIFVVVLLTCGLCSSAPQQPYNHIQPGQAEQHLNGLVTVLDFVDLETEGILGFSEESSRNVDAKLELMLHLLQIWRNARFGSPPPPNFYQNNPGFQKGPPAFNPGFQQFPGNTGVNQFNPGFQKLPGNINPGFQPGSGSVRPNEIPGHGHFHSHDDDDDDDDHDHPHGPFGHTHGPSGQRPSGQRPSGHTHSHGPSGHSHSHGHTHTHGDDDHDHSHENEEDIEGSDPEHTPQEVFNDSFQKGVVQVDKKPIIPIFGGDH